MKILDRYVLGQLLPAFLLCIIAFLSLYITIDLFSRIDEVFKNHIPLHALVQYYVTLAPIVSVQMIPIGLLLSILYTLGSFTKNNEITAMRAAGINIWQIAFPLILFSLVVSLLTFFLHNDLAPAALKRSVEIEEKYMKGAEPASISVLENVTYYGTNNSLFYARSFDRSTNVLENITILLHDEKRNLTSKIMATRAEWIGNQWKCSHCTTLTLDPTGKVTGEVITETEKIIDIDMAPKDLTRKHSQIDTMSLAELQRYISKLNRLGGRTMQRLITEFHHKIAFPFASLAIVFVGIPLALRTTRGGTWVGIGISIMMCFGYYLLMAIFLALGKGGTLNPVIAAWSTNALFVLTGFILFFRLTRFSF